MIRSIHRATWYRIALYLPIIIPVFVILIYAIAQQHSFHWPRYAEYHYLYSDMFFIYNPIHVFFILQLWLAGLPYISFACGVLYWGRDKTLRQIERASWLLPILFIPLCLFYTSFLLSEFTLGMLPVVFLFGYFYVFLAHGITWLFTKIGIVYG